MRIAVSTVGLPGVPLAGLPGAARAVGAEGIALGVGPSGPMAVDAPSATVAAFHQACRDGGVAVSAVYGYPGRKLLTDAAQADLDLAKRCIDLAAALGAPVCRVFAGTAPGPDAVIDRFVAACRPIAAHAAAAGVCLGLPTHHDLAFDARTCRRLVDGLGRGKAGIIFTGPNLEQDGIAPLDALADMAGLVVQAEIKDWVRHGTAVHPAPIGTGQAIVWPLVTALAAAGFPGWITLHHLRQHHPDLPPLDPAISTRIRAIIAHARSA